MSRKANKQVCRDKGLELAAGRVSEDARGEWACVRMWAATKGYCAYKPNNGWLHDALVILEHEVNERNPMVILSAVAQELLMQAAESKFSAILVVDVGALLKLRPDDETDFDILGQESLSAQYGKRFEKPVIRFLDRMYLKEATLVGRGVLCEFVLKMMSPVASRALTEKNVKRIVLIHPILRPAFINSDHMSDAAAAKLTNVTLDAVYSTAKEQMRRDRILRHFCPNGNSMTWAQHVDPQNVGEILLATFMTERVGGGANEISEYDSERFDELGKSMFFAEVRIVMDVRTKRDKQLSIDVTVEIFAEDVEMMAAAGDAGAALGGEGTGSINVAQCATVHAGLLLRGNRCVLYRSTERARPHMRVPFVIHDEEEAAGGGGGGAASGGAAAPTGRKRGRLIAMREISDLCEIEAEEEVVPLPAIPPVTIFKPCGEPVVLILHALYAVNPPPSSTSDDGLLAEDPEWDEDYTYDWYTFPRAIAALKECGDQATIVALQSLAYALKGAAMAGVLPMKWGGVFGQEFAGGADGEDAASSPPCEEEECHAKAKAAPPSSP